MKRLSRRLKIIVAAGLGAVLTGGLIVAVGGGTPFSRLRATAYFDSSNGIYPGDDVLMLGVPIGKIDSIEPQPERVKVVFWYSSETKVPAEAKAVVLSPQLVTARAIQLVPAYTTGPVLADGATIPQSRTAVPVEWDDLRVQLQKVAEALQPAQNDGTSPIGELLGTAANNLRGQGQDIRNTVIKLSQSLSALGDHSEDLFGSIKNLSTLVTALQSSTDLMRQLNRNLAGVTAVLGRDPNAIGQVVSDINTAAGKVREFAIDNRDRLGTSSDRLAAISQAVKDNLGDVKQALHVAPSTFQNFINIYDPIHAANTGAMAINNFANPIGFLCGAIQAASRLGAEQASRLCVQYLAPIVKNRQYNFLPIGLNPFVGAMARPNELTYSEDWLRPDYQPAAGPQPGDVAAENAGDADVAQPGGNDAPVGPVEIVTNPAEGLPGMMVPGS